MKEEEYPALGTWDYEPAVEGIRKEWEEVQLESRGYPGIQYCGGGGDE